jgi:acyl carrier protein
MSDDEIRNAFIAEIRNIAPDADPAAIDPRADIRDALDLDSMDILNLVIALTRRLTIEIPEIDYPKLLTIDGATAYLAAKRRAGA